MGQSYRAGLRGGGEGEIYGAELWGGGEEGIYGAELWGGGVGQPFIPPRVTD